MRKSKIGIILSSIYLILSISFIIFGNFICKGIYCDPSLFIVLPLLPWFLILDFENGIMIISILINLSIWYLIGFIIEKIIFFFKNR